MTWKWQTNISNYKMSWFNWTHDKILHSHPVSLKRLISLVAYILCSAFVHTLDAAVFFYSSLCYHKIQLSGTRLHLVVNLLDCFMEQRQIASQPKTGSRYCCLSVRRSWTSNTRKSSRCLFVSLWRTILPSYLGENWTERTILTVLDGLRAWYRMCDQLKTHSCSFSHLFEAALYYRLLRCLDVMCHSRNESPGFSFVLISRVAVWYILIHLMFSCCFCFGVLTWTIGKQNMVLGRWFSLERGILAPRNI